MTNWIRSLFSSSKGNKTRVRPRIKLDDALTSIYAIGDVHGCLQELRQLEQKIFDDGQHIAGEKLIILLGDYIDRGPFSASVIDHLMGPAAPGFTRICLAGNHDDMFLDFLDNPSGRADWLTLGGYETLASYGVYIEGARDRQIGAQLRSLIPLEHIQFLQSLPVMATNRNFCFVHAGIDPTLPIEAQTDNTLLHSRPSNFDWSAYTGSQTVIHGHTPIESVELGAARINLDLNVYKSGQLASLRLTEDGMKVMLSG